jgi:hypothetical protein
LCKIHRFLTAYSLFSFPLERLKKTEAKKWRRFRRERFRVIWFATGQSIRSINLYSKVIGDRNFVHSMHQGTLYGNDSFILDARHSAIVGNGNTLQQGRNSVLIGRANRILECVTADANRLVFVDLIKKPTVYYCFVVGILGVLESATGFIIIFNNSSG